MVDQNWGEEYRTTRVCVDAYEAGVLKGRFYHPMRPEGEVFRGLSQFLLKTGLLLDEMAWPKADTKIRTFGDGPVLLREKDGAERRQTGLLATFRVRILFRQHASWQGEIIWMEQAVSQCFRSVLELIHLLDSALQKDDVPERENRYLSERRTFHEEESEKTVGVDPGAEYVLGTHDCASPCGRS